ncbi:MAG: GNAT family N-acetyltransferase [Chloroflexota bacterium]
MTRAVRPATAADLEAIAALGHAAVNLRDYPDATHGDVERNMAVLTAEPSAASVAVAEGSVVGYLAPRLNDLYVADAHRRRGLGTALVEAALPYVRDVLRHPYLLLYVPPGDTPGRRFAEALGFAHRASLYWMERPADDPGPAPDLPPGFVARAWDPARDAILAFVELLNDSFADHPTPVSWTEAIIRAAHSAPEFDPGDILLVAPAEAPERVIAFCRARSYPADDPPYGEVKLIGVLPPWRGRGLGRALLRWGVHHLQGRGIPTTALAVSAANKHALRMYEAHGFRRVVEWPQWSRDA